MAESRNGESMKPSFWVTRGGLIGTAHLNRDGKEVDFREGTARPRGSGFEVLEVHPQKGVECPPPPLVLASELVTSVPYFGDAINTYVARWGEGVVTCKVQVKLPRDITPQEVEAEQIAAQARRALHEKAAERMATMSPAEFWRLAAPNAVERGRLRRRDGRWEEVHHAMMLRVRNADAVCAQALATGFTLHFSFERSAKFRAYFLSPEFEKQRKAAEDDHA